MSQALAQLLPAAHQTSHWFDFATIPDYEDCEGDNPSYKSPVAFEIGGQPDAAWMPPDACRNSGRLMVKFFPPADGKFARVKCWVYRMEPYLAPWLPANVMRVWHKDDYRIAVVPDEFVLELKPEDIHHEDVPGPCFGRLADLHRRPELLRRIPVVCIRRPIRQARFVIRQNPQRMYLVSTSGITEDRITRYTIVARKPHWDPPKGGVLIKDSRSNNGTNRYYAVPTSRIWSGDV
jgi:hypothetical protein